MKLGIRMDQAFSSSIRQTSLVPDIYRKIMGKLRSGESLDVNRSFRCLLIGVLSPLFGVCGASGQDLRTAGTGNATTLQTLPPMQALPITSNSDTPSPDALSPPAYCDTPTLRSSATIRAIRFWDDSRGIAVGDLGCILMTQDGGQTWKQSASDVECRLNDAAWIDANRVIAIGGGLDVVTHISRGTVVISVDSGLTWKRGNDSDLPRLDRIATSDAKRTTGGRRERSLTAHGDPDPISGASIFKSRDGGSSWQAEIGDQPDDRIGGPPTSKNRSITADHAARWSALTKTPTAIRTSCRLDPRTLLAAGDHGTILRSVDGGHHWDTVHGEDASCGVLVIASRRRLVPWSLVGREALEKRLRVNIVIGNTTDQHFGFITDGLEQAAMNVGAAALDTFPMSSEHESVVALKQWIDVHDPPIIAIDATLNSKIKSILLQHAVANGTDKVIEYSSVQRGGTLLHHSALLPQSGVLAGDFDEDCRLLVSDFGFSRNDASPHQWVSINTRYSNGNKFTHGDSLGVGVQLTSRNRLPARVSKASGRRLQVIRGRLKQQVAIDNLFESADGHQRPLNSERFTQSMRLLLDQTSRADQFRSAWAIARRSHGKRHQAIVWDELSNRFSGSSATRLAGLHADARFASVEWERHRMFLINEDRSYASRDHQAPIVAQVGAIAPLPDAPGRRELVPDYGGHSAIVSPFQSNTIDSSDSKRGVIQASASMPLDDPGTNHFGMPRHRGRGLSPLANQDSSQAQVDLAWQMHPIRLIVEDAINRNTERAALEQAYASDPTTANVSASSESSKPVSSPATSDTPLASENHSADLRRIAQRQTAWAALLNSTSPQVAIAAQTDSPPHLDGRLTEPFWADDQSKPATTRGQEELQLRFAWDDRYIFVALQTPARRFRMTEASENVGIRDADLSDADHVSVAFDIDRDLLTAMKIAFTRQGQTHDDIDGFASWNPTWYVASHESAGVVTTEIAIERSSLSATVRAGDSWFIMAKTISAGEPESFEMMPDAKSRVRVDFR